MARVIINRPRSGSGFAAGIKTRLRIRNVPQPMINFVDWETDELEEFDIPDSPNRISRRHRWTNHDWSTKSQTDHLSPLLHFLEKNVGKVWSEVWHEICAVTSNHSIDGNHLRDHVRGYVDIYGNYRRYANFFVDSKGVLRRRIDEKYEPSFGEIVAIELSEVHKIELLKEHWFQVYYRKLPKGALLYTRTDGTLVLREKDEFTVAGKRQLHRKQLNVLRDILAQPWTRKELQNEPLIAHTKKKVKNFLGEHEVSFRVWLPGSFRFKLESSLA